MPDNNAQTNAPSAEQLENTRTEYRRARKQYAMYPAAVALAYARALVSLRIVREMQPDLAERVPYIYGHRGQLDAFAHACAGDAWKRLFAAGYATPGLKQPPRA